MHMLNPEQQTPKPACIELPKRTAEMLCKLWLAAQALAAAIPHMLPQWLLCSAINTIRPRAEHQSSAINALLQQPAKHFIPQQKKLLHADTATKDVPRGSPAHTQTLHLCISAQNQQRQNCVQHICMHVS
jgi:hypothetical protein